MADRHLFLLDRLHGRALHHLVIATLIKKEEWKPTAKIGAAGALVLLMSAPVLLIVDLNQPLRFWHLFVYLNPASPLTWGSIFLALDAIVCVVYAYYVFQDNSRMARAWGLAGLPVAIAGHGYAGFFLALSKARAFWNTALNPALFMVSAMVSGLAVLIILSNLWLHRYSPTMSEEQVEKRRGVIGTLLRLFIIFIVADLFLIGSDLTVLASSNTESYAMLQLLDHRGIRHLVPGNRAHAGGVSPPGAAGSSEDEDDPGGAVCLRGSGDYRDFRDESDYCDRRPVSSFNLRERGTLTAKSSASGNPGDGAFLLLRKL